MELEFLFAFDIRLHVTTATCNNFCKIFEKEIARQNVSIIERIFAFFCGFLQYLVDDDDAEEEEEAADDYQKQILLLHQQGEPEEEHGISITSTI